MGGEGLPENTIWCFQAFLYPKLNTENARRITQRSWDLSPCTAKGHRKEDITMFEDLICPTGSVRLPATSAHWQSGSSFHLFAHLLAGGGPTDAGSSICPLPKGVRPPRERASHPLSSGVAVILLNSFYNRDGLLLYCFPENWNYVIPRL